MDFCLGPRLSNGLEARSHGLGLSHIPVHHPVRFSWVRNGVHGETSLLRGASGLSGKWGRRYAVVCCSGREKGKTAVIVGAGPAGALLALLLARQDWKVDVFERKHWSGASWASEQPEGWNVMLGARAAYCLENVGLKEDVWSEGVLCSGRTAVTGGGLKPKYQPYGYELLAIPQPKLASVLINSGMRQYPDQISYHFGWALQSLHPEDTMAEFCPAGSTGQDKMVVTADLVVGADGLHSRTRTELETKAAGFKSTVHSVPAGRHIR